MATIAEEASRRSRQTAMISGFGGSRCSRAAVFCLAVMGAFAPAAAQQNWQSKQVQSPAMSFTGPGVQTYKVVSPTLTFIGPGVQTYKVVSPTLTFIGPEVQTHIVQSSPLSFIGSGQAQAKQLEAGQALAGQLAQGDERAVAEGGAARQKSKRVKAKIKAVAVVKGDNLFDPSGKGQTAAVPTSGEYVGSFAVVRDPCKLEGKIGLARGGQTLTAATRGATLDVSGGPPFVKVSGPAAGNPAALSGNGTAAGQSANVSASANFGGGGRNSLTMDYVMTLAGRCAVTTTNAGANAVVYRFTGRKR